MLSRTVSTLFIVCAVGALLSACASQQRPDMAYADQPVAIAFQTVDAQKPAPVVTAAEPVASPVAFNSQTPWPQPKSDCQVNFEEKIAAAMKAIEERKARI